MSANAKILVYWIKTTDVNGKISDHGIFNPTENLYKARYHAIEYLLDTSITTVEICSKWVLKNEHR